MITVHYWTAVLSYQYRDHRPRNMVIETRICSSQRYHYLSRLHLQQIYKSAPQPARQRAILIITKCNKHYRIDYSERHFLIPVKLPNYYQPMSYLQRQYWTSNLISNRALSLNINKLILLLSILNKTQNSLMKIILHL